MRLSFTARALTRTPFSRPISFGLALAFAPLASACSAPQPLEPPRLLPAPEADVAARPGLQSAVLAGGCFWGVQGVFQHVRGVTSVVSGYAGGKPSTARYELVGTGTTGHAESVKITYDPRQISYGQILRIFFSVATDPTQVGGQFTDRGPQYRTEVFYLDADQKRVAQAYIAQLTRARAFSRPIVTRVDPLPGFYAAEAYHQDYLTLHPTQPYIANLDIPKVQALKALFPSYYRTQPVLVNARS